MIIYDAGDTLAVVFAWIGTVWPSILWKLGAVWVYAVLCYIVSLTYCINFGTEGHTILLGTMSFLLIFRANQAYTRYMHGRSFLTDFFTHIREFGMLCMTYTRGGVYTCTFLFEGGPGLPPKDDVPEDHLDAEARELRVDIVRLCIAACVALKLHTRIASDGYCYGAIDSEEKMLLDWDRFRLCQLLSRDEFRLIDECVGIIEEEGRDYRKGEDPVQRFAVEFRGHYSGEEATPPADWPRSFEVNTSPYPRPFVAVTWLMREVVVRNMNDMTNRQPWGIKERFVGELVGLIAGSKGLFEMINQIITSPVPLPYANLCKLLLLIFLLSMPFYIDYRLGWFANTVIPGVVSLALLGIDAIATELENPFGDDTNDLDILEMIHVLECELLQLLRLTGDFQAGERFAWRPMPDFVANSSCKRLKYYLVVADFAAAEESDDAGKDLPCDAIVEWQRQRT